MRLASQRDYVRSALKTRRRRSAMAERRRSSHRSGHGVERLVGFGAGRIRPVVATAGAGPIVDREVEAVVGELGLDADHVALRQDVAVLRPVLLVEGFQLRRGTLIDGDALDRLLGNLRGKLRRFDPAELIQTRPGLGYVLLP